MKVSELAKEWSTTSDVILEALKALKLKSKDSKQELGTVVVSVLKSEFKKRGGVPRKDVKLRGKDEVAELKEKKIVKKRIPVKKKEAVTPVKKKVTASEGKIKSKSDEKEKEKKDEGKVKGGKLEAQKTLDVKSEKVSRKGSERDATAAEKKEKKIIVKKTTSSHRKMASEPVITLKPLAHKRKKVVVRDKDVRKEFFSKEKKDTLLSVDVDKVEESKSQLVDSDSGLSAHEKAKQLAQDQDTDSVQKTVKEIDAFGWKNVVRDEFLPDIEVKVPITIKELSIKIQQKPSVILKKLMMMGILVHINQSLDAEIVSRITGAFGFNLVKIKTQEEQLIEFHKEEEKDPALFEPRPPVVTFMGHVDHGKTTLLDRLRKSNVVDTEHGGITQHMGAYSVNIAKGTITLLDTPGHEAFTAMRARSAHITDIVVLVVAADEGIMPQTEEAINHARAANVPMVIALNKIDRKNADVDRVKKQLAEFDLTPEDWGGKTIVANVSALTGEGVDNLLDMILLESEMLELKANKNKPASGIVVEAHRSQGKGAVTTLIVQNGTLKDQDIIIAGPYYGKVRAMFDDHNNMVKEAGPSIPVEVLGLSDVPEAGESFYVVNDEKQGRDISLRRKEQLKNSKLQSIRKITLEDLYSQLQKDVVKEFNVILKSDVQGSLEALKDSLRKIPSDKVKINFIHSGVGDVSASDILLAVASKAIIIAFHVDVNSRAKEELEKEPVDVRKYRIIYDAVSDIKNALEGLLEAKTRKKFLSRIEIRQVFKLSKHGIIAGCYVTKGKVFRKAKMDIIRDSKIIFSGEISSLKKFKDDVREVNEGMECGISISGFDSFQSGDIIETYEVESIAQKL